MRTTIVTAMLVLGIGLASGPDLGAKEDGKPDEFAEMIAKAAALGDLDEEQLTAACQELQRQFQGDYVVDLAALRDAAKTLLPLLEQNEETKPYAAWLRARLDYLDVAEELRLAVPPPTEPGPPVAPPRNPVPDAERRVWREKLKRRPEIPGTPAYVRRLKPIFTAQHVPPELVWLAEVESGFDARARSPVGAAGLFQLMPDTAKTFGLALRPKDQRYDPDRSAAAASRYLRYLYGRFGDWRLSVAAYNAGESRVRRLLDRHRARSFDEIAEHLPAETQMYVPKVEATILRREGLALANLRRPTAAP